MPENQPAYRNPAYDYDDMEPSVSGAKDIIEEEEIVPSRDPRVS